MRFRKYKKLLESASQTVDLSSENEPQLFLRVTDSAQVQNIRSSFIAKMPTIWWKVSLLCNQSTKVAYFEVRKFGNPNRYLLTEVQWNWNAVLTVIMATACSKVVCALAVKWVLFVSSAKNYNDCKMKLLERVYFVEPSDIGRVFCQNEGHVSQATVDDSRTERVVHSVQVDRVTSPSAFCARLLKWNSVDCMAPTADGNRLEVRQTLGCTAARTHRPHHFSFFIQFNTYFVSTNTARPLNFIFFIRYSILNFKILHTSSICLLWFIRSRHAIWHAKRALTLGPKWHGRLEQD